MTSACVKWGHALGFSGSLGEFDKLSLNFEVKVTSPRSKLPRGALSDHAMVGGRGGWYGTAQTQAGRRLPACVPLRPPQTGAVCLP